MADFVDFNLSLNLEEVGTWDGTYKGPDPGEYTFEVTNAEQVQTSNGNPGVRFTFAVVDEDSDQKGRTVNKTYTLKNDPKVLARFKHLITVLGVDPNNINGSELLGKRMIAECYKSQMKDRTAADGSVIEGKEISDLRGERPVEGPEVEAAPPPAPPTAPTAGRKAVGAAKNGTATARR